MIDWTIDGVDYKLPNHPSEVNLSTFEKMYNLMQVKDIGAFDRYMKIFALFGISEDVTADVDEMKLVEKIKEFNAVTVTDSNLQKSIEINGRLYVAYEDEFKFKAKDIVEIERAAMQGVTNFPSMILSILFKDQDLGKHEHYTPAHLKHKAKLFAENLSTDVAIPYLALVAQKTLKAIKNVE